MARLRAAVIGLGRIASTIDDEIQKYDDDELPRSHIGCYAEHPAIDLVGMSDTWPEQREAARRKWRFDALYDDFREMLRATKPEIVSVCTSAMPRADVLLEIANGGYGVKAIWSEKPITISLDEADRVIDACRRAGIVLAVNCQWRWRGVNRQALDIINDGVIGSVQHVQALGQCGLSHNGSHLLTSLTMFAGARAAWVVGEVESDAAAASDNDFQGAGYIGFPNGVRGYFRSLPNGPNEWSWEITGATGMIRLYGASAAAELWTMADPLPGMRRRPATRQFLPSPLRPRSAMLHALDDLVRCVQTGDAPKCSGEDAREALEIAIATRESHRRGRVRVDLPLEDRRLRIISSEVVRFSIPRAVARARGVAGA